MDIIFFQNLPGRGLELKTHLQTTWSSYIDAAGTVSKINPVK